MEQTQYPVSLGEELQRDIERVSRLNEGKVVAVDMDGTLCEGEVWTPEDVLTAAPRPAVVARVNELAKTKHIIIWTARRDHLIPATLEWLRRNGVSFHAISNMKMPADLYVDDKTITPEVFANG